MYLEWENNMINLTRKARPKRRRKSSNEKCHTVQLTAAASIMKLCWSSKCTLLGTYNLDESVAKYTWTSFPLDTAVAIGEVSMHSHLYKWEGTKFHWAFLCGKFRLSLSVRGSSWILWPLPVIQRPPNCRCECMSICHSCIEVATCPPGQNMVCAWFFFFRHIIFKLTFCGFKCRS